MRIANALAKALTAKGAAAPTPPQQVEKTRSRFVQLSEITH
jgi:hypothetical protein